MFHPTREPLTRGLATNGCRLGNASNTTANYRLADRLFQRAVIFALCLEVCVIIEPAPVDIVIVVLLGAGLLFGKLSFREVKPLSLVALALFAAANIVSMGGAYDVRRAVFYLGVTLYMVFSWFFFVGVLGRYGTAFVETMVRTYCIAGLVSAVLGIVGYFHVVPFYNLLLVNGRASGLYKDCNVFGPYFVLVVLISFARLTSPAIDWKHKLNPMIMFVLGGAALLLSFSRAAWINCFVALALLLIGQVTFLGTRQERQKRLIGGVLLLGAGAFLVVVGLALPAVDEMLSKRVTSSGLKDYDRVRFATQDLALKTSIERPLGIGPGQSEEVLGYATHSTYMRLLSENGALSLLMFLAFIATTLFRAFTVMRKSNSPAIQELNLIIFGCIAGYLVNSLVVDTVHWRNIWFICAIPWTPYSFTSNKESANRWLSSISDQKLSHAAATF